MTNDADVIVIGGGIAGMSAAAVLARHVSVILLEAEDQPGYHATGRSAAYFAPGYGNSHIRTITNDSERFFYDPPAGFSESPLLLPRAFTYIARADQIGTLRDEANTLGAKASLIDAKTACKQVPILREDYVSAALHVPGGGDLDVGALLQSFVRLLRQRGGTLIRTARVRRLEKRDSSWEVHAANEIFRAPVIVNACGAWADEFAALAGFDSLDLKPKRRTACLVDPPSDADITNWPLVADIDEQFYFKPDAGRLLLSPADETNSAPCDAQPDDLDVAIAVDRFEKATTINVARVSSQWAGLRTFSSDKSPVVGFDPRAHGFFWLAAQGGYGVQTSPGLAQLTNYLITGEIDSHGFENTLGLADALSPARFL